MNERNRLEKLAIAAHRRGDDWRTFWPSVAADVAALFPMDNRGYHRFVGRLTALLAAGDTAGMTPPVNGWSEPCPWELDDAAATAPVLSPDDSETAARIDWSAAKVQRVHSFGG